MPISVGNVVRDVYSNSRYVRVATFPISVGSDGIGLSIKSSPLKNRETAFQKYKCLSTGKSPRDAGTSEMLLDIKCAHINTKYDKKVVRMKFCQCRDVV